MPKVIFDPGEQSFDADPNTKLLVVAIRNKVPIRYGCASCRCGTCAVAVDHAAGEVKPMRPEEQDLLRRMGLPVDGSVRLACQTRVMDGTIRVDLSFQDTYSPDQAESDWDD